MKYKLTEHKGIEIFYDEGTDRFVCDLDERERSFHALKAMIAVIDKHKTEPPSEMTALKNGEQITVYGVHSNGNVLMRLPDGTKKQHTYGILHVCSEKNLQLYAELEKVCEEEQSLINRKQAIRAEMEVFDTVAYSNKYRP